MIQLRRSLLHLERLLLDPQHAAPSSDPEISLGIFRQRASRQDINTSRVRDSLKLAIAKGRDATRRNRPQCAPAILVRAPDSIPLQATLLAEAHQPVTLVSQQPICRTDPQCTRRILEKIVDRVAL